MDTDQVNRLITDEVETVEDGDVKRFIRDILAHERKYIDRENYEYKQKYKDLIKEYTETSEI
jgi:hypothetical protein